MGLTAHFHHRRQVPTRSWPKLAVCKLRPSVETKRTALQRLPLEQAPCPVTRSHQSCEARDGCISAKVSSCPRNPQPCPHSLPEILGNQLYFQPLGFPCHTACLRNRWPQGSEKEEDEARPHSPKDTVLSLKVRSRNLCHKSSQQPQYGGSLWRLRQENGRFQPSTATK